MSAFSAPPRPPAGPQAPYTPARLAETARRIAARPASWRPLARFTSPERWYHRLHRAEGYEVWLLTWLPGQGTEIHDHGGSGGAFTVVAGTLTEETFPGARRLLVGGLRSFGPRHIHRVSNRGTEPAVSVHAYGPALTSQTYYRLGADGALLPDRTETMDD
ncbi:cysteine dioxygenase [Streptomyces carpaticus]|uniref:Cysteine dioxygenase family protein n=1 Tax=Streptomyces carpaticus TaxID=285558 RepID=A0ABV4ZHC0_9ACTN